MRKFLFGTTLFLVMMALCVAVNAQKFKKMKPVEYLQLPTVKGPYAKAHVYAAFDQSMVRETMKMGFGKITGEGKQAGNVMQELIDKAFADDTNTYTSWDMYSKFLINPHGEEDLKVVITYAPDEQARPMAAPMKNNDQMFTFEYRVYVKMHVYDKNNKLIMEKDYGVVSGTGHSETWPENTDASKGLGGMLTVTEDDGGTASMHPYSVACLDGAVEQCQREVFGLYGIQRFSLPLGVAHFKSDKDSKDYQKNYEELMENKSSLLLSEGETAVVKECVEYWNGLLGKADKDELWGVHYNLALGYSWLLDENKSVEHFNKAVELEKDVLDKVINKSASFNQKDIEVLERINLATAFANYYAKGINANPGLPELLQLPVPQIVRVLAYNNSLANLVGMPMAFPVVPYNGIPGDIKSGSGQITYKGQPLLDLKYNFKGGQFTDLSIEGIKESAYKKVKEEITALPDPESELTLYERSFDHGYEVGDSKTKGIVKLTIDGEFRLNGYEAEYNHMFPGLKPGFPVDNPYTEIKYSDLGTRYGKDYMIASQWMTSDNEWTKTEYYAGDSAHITLSSGLLSKKVEANALNEQGHPVSVNITYTAKDFHHGMYALYKEKFGEETSKAQSKRLDLQLALEPVLRKKYFDSIKNPEVLDDKGHFNLEFTDKIMVEYKYDDHNNWSEIKIGDFVITRNLDYK